MATRKQTVNWQHCIAWRPNALRGITGELPPLNFKKLLLPLSYRKQNYQSDQTRKRSQKSKTKSCSRINFANNKHHKSWNTNKPIPPTLQILPDRHCRIARILLANYCCQSLHLTRRNTSTTCIPINDQPCLQRQGVVIYRISVLGITSQ